VTKPTEALAILRDERALLWQRFMGNGGRGVQLAEEIDAMDRKIKKMESAPKKSTK